MPDERRFEHGLLQVADGRERLRLSPGWMQVERVLLGLDRAAIPNVGPAGVAHAALDTLPRQKTPTERDWEQLSRGWAADVDARIATLQAIRGRLTTCIGCGCLSLKTCGLLNPGDEAAGLGAGARYFERGPSAARPVSR